MFFVCTVLECFALLLAETNPPGAEEKSLVPYKGAWDG